VRRVSVKEKSWGKRRWEIVHEELGLVTDGSVEVDGMEWGMISEWKDRMIRPSKVLSKEEAGAALGSI
jgi:hypothetical protein